MVEENNELEKASSEILLTEREAGVEKKLTGLGFYEGISQLDISQEEAAQLTESIPDNEFEILAGGEVYLPTVRYRFRLNKIFGPGKWGLFELKSELDMSTKVMFFDGVLFIRGLFASKTRGDARYFPNNPKTTLADAYESARSNALKRCCKDIGIGWEAWDPNFTKAWMARNAYLVEVLNNENKREHIWLKNGDKVKYPYREIPELSVPDEYKALLTNVVKLGMDKTTVIKIVEGLSTNWVAAYPVFLNIESELKKLEAAKNVSTSKPTPNKNS